jgi:hypothetical protein
MWRASLLTVVRGSQHGPLTVLGKCVCELRALVLLGAPRVLVLQVDVAGEAARPHRLPVHRQPTLVLAARGLRII